MNSFSQFLISESHENELYILCRDLRNKKLKNSPWSPFFVENEHIKRDTDLFNVYEISEVPVEEVKTKNNDHDTPIAMSDDEEMCVDESAPKSTSMLNKVLEDQLLKLRTMLLDIKKDYPSEQCCPEVTVFNSISPCQVPSACEVLQLSTLSEVAIAVLLNSLSLLEPAISLSTAASVIHHAVYIRMKSWTSDTSRALTTGILMYTKKYPKAIIDELLLLCLKDESFDTSQADLLQDVIKSGVPDDQVLYCLRECLEISSPNETALIAIHCLIERKVMLNTDLHHTLTERIYNWSTALNSSVKFSKLLKSVISVYGNQMTEEQLSALNTVVKNNSTFLKKSMENLLKKSRGKHLKSV